MFPFGKLTGGNKNNGNSPAPVAGGKMTFLQAFAKLIEGKKIRSSYWPAAEYAFLHDGFVTVHRANTFYRWSISDGDIKAVDWVIYG